MSDTPRTDAALSCRLDDPDRHATIYRQVIDLCRRLERELSEAEKLAKRWYDAAAPYATPKALREALRSPTGDGGEA